MIQILFAIALLGFNVEIQKYVGYSAEGPVEDTYVCADNGAHGACLSLNSFTVEAEYSF